MIDNEELIKNEIKEELCSFVKRYEDRAEITSHWGQPLVGFADAKHPFVLNLKNIVGENHELPSGVLSDASIVIAYYVPFTKDLAKTNAAEPRLAAPSWALTYEETNAMFSELNAYLISYLTAKGYRAAVSREASTFSSEKLISNWSHRHFAYAAGLGTFGINNMLITARGCCGRFSTIVTNLPIQADAPRQEEMCLYKKNGKCKVCIKHCPVGALTETSYDRKKCYAMLKENAEIYTDFGSSYVDEGLEEANSVGSEVCGKCITGSPCAFFDTGK